MDIWVFFRKRLRVPAYCTISIPQPYVIGAKLTRRDVRTLTQEKGMREAKERLLRMRAKGAEVSLGA